MSKTLKSKVIKIDFESDEGVTFPTVTNILINFDEDQFYVRFYQVKPPPNLDGVLPESVSGELVAGFVVPEAKLKDIVRAMQENIEQREKLQRAKAEIDFDSLMELEGNDE